MNQNKHANEMAARFREIYETNGESFSDEHYEELVLLIESGLDAALIEKMEKLADQLTNLAHSIRHNAETTASEQDEQA